MDRYEQRLTHAWQNSREIRCEFDRLKAKEEYEDLIVNQLAYKWQVDAGTIRSILKRTEENR